MSAFDAYLERPYDQAADDQAALDAFADDFRGKPASEIAALYVARKGFATAEDFIAELACDDMAFLAERMRAAREADRNDENEARA